MDRVKCSFCKNDIISKDDSVLSNVGGGSILMPYHKSCFNEIAKKNSVSLSSPGIIGSTKYDFHKKIQIIRLIISIIIVTAIVSIYTYGMIKYFEVKYLFTILILIPIIVLILFFPIRNLKILNKFMKI